MNNTQQLKKADVNTGECGETIYVDLRLRVQLPVGMTPEQLEQVVEWEGIFDSGNLYVGWEGKISSLMTIDDVTGAVHWPEGWEKALGREI